MNVAFKRIGALLAGLLLLVYLGYHTLVVPYTSIKTEQATAHTARETIVSDKTFIIRSEKTVSSNVAGSYRYNINNGERVANTPRRSFPPSLGGRTVALHSSRDDSENSQISHR